ncbi:ABC transporter substrate-binding protein [uncultured Fusobacterium sp.]|jgi:oligogalacturonide transport system substrate-binding protein|uniref:ABC transporter substrate-binding protein n=1 Tax=uncultured Fusobacterium sp. TaxID=159267 RepID=UPI0025F37B43|nr:ABC transporter substrate-binding protein [uncultured Fusobacterium sp.]MCF2640362.1 carbohydrate ABC transporter substrate-binding protein [Fusobacterium varium]
MNLKKILLMSSLCLSMAYPTIAEGKTVNLKMSWWGGDARHKQTLEAIKLFEEKYPEIKVKPEYGGWQGWQEKVTTQIVGNTSPDVMQINWNWIDLFSRDGDGFYDLNKVKDILELDKNYSQELLDQCIVNGKLNALPVGVTGKVFYINKTTYEKAGLPVPTSFDEMIKSAKVIREKLGDDYYAFDTDAYGAILLMLYKLEQETGKPFIVDNKVAYTEAEVIEAVRFYDNLVKEKVMPSLKVRAAAGFIPLDQHPGWIQGRYAGTYEWDSSAQKWQDALEAGQELVVAPYPQDFGTNKSGFNKVSMAYAIKKNTKHPEEAATLIHFLTSDPEAIKILGTSRGVPSNETAVAVLKENNQLTGLGFEANTVVKEFAGKGIHPLFEHKRLNTELRTIVENLGYEQKTVEETARDIINITNEFLAENN